jgi:hypothetical protein
VRGDHDKLAGIHHTGEWALSRLTFTRRETPHKVVKPQSNHVACSPDKLLRRRIQEQDTIVVIQEEDSLRNCFQDQACNLSYRKT